MNTNILTIVNNNDGTYTITFSDTITNENPGTPTTDPNFLFFSQAQGAWVPITFNAPESGNTIVVSVAGGDTLCDAAILLAQPAILTSPNPFEQTTPVTPVS